MGNSVAWWIGRTVRTDDDADLTFGPAVVLAVDDTPHAPSAWIKFDIYPPCYQSIDMSELVDIETGKSGPRWGAGGPEAATALALAARQVTTPSPASE